MGDAVLATLLGIIQLFLGVMGVYVSLRPPDKRWHLYWILAFTVVGCSGIWLTFTLARHADVAQQQATHEIREAEAAATSANTAATKANDAAMGAQKETQVARDEARQAQQSLSALINKTSRETTKALVQLSTTTESSVKGIPRARRIQNEIKPKLIADLSLHRGVVTINYMGGDGEAMQFANDWYNLLSEAGWTITSGINAIYSPDFVTGTRITIKGEQVTSKQVFKISGEHPAAALARALFVVTPDVIGQREPNLMSNVTILDIGAIPTH